MSFYDFNTAKESNFDVIPAGTIARVNMRIKPGGYNDEDMGWTGGYASQSQYTGAIYLNCEFTILEGDYVGRKVWGLIGLCSDKNDNVWGDIGRSFIRSILNSSRGFSDNDTSNKAVAARKIRSLADLDGIEFVAKIDIKKDDNSDYKNVIKASITPDHEQYAACMNKAVDQPIPWD